MSWYHYAACQAKDSELFFPIGAGRPALLQLEEAKRVCRRCPVQSLCLEWAMLARIDYGVWSDLKDLMIPFNSPMFVPNPWGR